MLPVPARNTDTGCAGADICLVVPRMRNLNHLQANNTRWNRPGAAQGESPRRPRLGLKPRKACAGSGPPSPAPSLAPPGTGDPSSTANPASCNL